RLVERRRRELLQILAQLGAERGVVHLGAADADDRELLRQEAGDREVVERRDQLALREVAGSAEDHQDARRRGLAVRGRRFVLSRRLAIHRPASRGGRRTSDAWRTASSR